MQKILIHKQTVSQKGQTLIETLVAIFILVMGISAALGLAIYSLNSTSNVSKQIVAVGLAREGVEALKNMRDTNWLHDIVMSDCYNYSNGMSSGAKCYHNWLTQLNYPDYSPLLGSSVASYLNGNIDPGGTKKDYNLIYDSNLANNNTYWGLYPHVANFMLGLNSCPGSNPGPLNYALDYFDDPTNNTTYTVKGRGFYRPACDANGNSGFYRKVSLQKDTAAPYDKNYLSRLKVTVRVWWRDKRCPAVADWDENTGQVPNSACRLELVSYLTNWKDY